MPILGNLFGTTDRVATAMGLEDVSQLRDMGQLLAFLRSPKLPDSFGGAMDMLPQIRKLATFNPRQMNSAPWQEVVYEVDEVDLDCLPIQTCWPGDAGPLITWGMVTTRGPAKKRQNLAIYRQQKIGRNRLIMRWLAHRGGALDYQDFRRKWPDKPFPLAVVLGADPANMLAAVIPIPDSLSEYQFAGLLRRHKTELTRCTEHDLLVPTSAEIVLEGFIHPQDTAQEGPFADHTGYYNSVAEFPVFTVTRLSHRRDAIYPATYMGKPGEDEPSVMATAMNEVFIPLLQDQFPEVVDFYLPPEGCSYRIAIVSIKKQYQGHAKRIMMGIWSWLRQFTYTKYIIVTDDDIDIRSWPEVIWAMTTRADPVRDSVLIENTPIDYLDFASPEPGLGGKLGIDATNKWPGETHRQWGTPVAMDAETGKNVDDLWQTLGI
jgi:4-hydroxy-3-polyprenylbenzoate decarboxylase